MTMILRICLVVMSESKDPRLGLQSLSVEKNKSGVRLAEKAIREFERKARRVK